MAKPKAKVITQEASKRVRAKSAEPKSKLDILTDALRRPSGASIVELSKLTGWQTHSVRGAMAGALKKRGHEITSTKEGKERRYHITRGK